MILKDNATIILYNRPVNMYKGFDGLLSIALTEIKIELSPDVFILFVNAERNRLKMLFFEQGNISIFALRLAGSMNVCFGENVKISVTSFYELIKNVKTKKRRSYYGLNTH